METRPSDEINSRIVELEKQLQAELQSLNIVQNQYSDVAREILVLKGQINSKEIEKKDLLKIMQKAKFNITQTELEIKIETKNFWSTKNSGQ